MSKPYAPRLAWNSLMKTHTLRLNVNEGYEGYRVMCRTHCTALHYTKVNMHQGILTENKQGGEKGKKKKQMKRKTNAVAAAKPVSTHRDNKIMSSFVGPFPT